MLRRGENRRERDNRNRWRHKQWEIEDEQFKLRYVIPKNKAESLKESPQTLCMSMLTLSRGYSMTIV